jgi:hypothetical protein
MEKYEFIGPYLLNTLVRSLQCVSLGHTHIMRRAFFVVVVLGFDLGAFHLLGKCSTT